jgi:hypothetical protein
VALVNKSKITVTLILISFISSASLFSQSRPHIFFEDNISASLKERIENYTAIFLNEISKAERFSSPPTFPLGCIIDSCAKKVADYWISTKFIVQPFNTIRIYGNANEGYNIKDLILISNYDSDLSGGVLYYTGEGVIKDFRLVYKRHELPANKVIAPDTLNIVMTLPALRQKISRADSSIVNSYKQNIEGVISCGVKSLLQNRTLGYNMGINLHYTFFKGYRAGVSAIYNVHKIKYEDSYGSFSKFKPYAGICFSAGFCFIKNLYLDMGYERTLFSFSDNGAFTEFSYKLKFISLKAGISHFPRYDYTFTSLSIGVTVF